MILNHQKARGASVYLLGNILHDFPETSCRRIIKNIVNVMEPDSKIILSEWCFPSCEVDEEQEVKSRREDINMLVMFNGSQRTVEGWERLCQSVNKRLYVSKIIAPPVVKRNLVEISLMKECREANHEEGT